MARQPKKSMAERMAERTHRTDGCWWWAGRKHRTGYGKVKTLPSRWAYAHRVAYELAYGPIPDGLLVCHHCDNPLCVRPDHLFVGTNADNVRDKVAKGRHLRRREQEERT